LIEVGTETGIFR